MMPATRHKAFLSVHVGKAKAYRIFEEAMAIILGGQHKCVQAVSDAELRPQKLCARHATLLWNQSVSD